MGARWVSLGLLVLTANSCTMSGDWLEWTTEPSLPPYAEVRFARSSHLDARQSLTIAVLPFRAAGARRRDIEVVRVAVASAIREVAGGQVDVLDGDRLGPERAEQGFDARPLQLDLLVELYRDFGCDAALFGTVTSLARFGDPAIGLELTLVDTRDGVTLWKASDLIDSREKDIRGRLRSFLTGAALSRRHPTAEDPQHVSLAAYSRFVARSYAQTLLPVVEVAEADEKVDFETLPPLGDG